jgi:hypothetical protein
VRDGLGIILIVCIAVRVGAWLVEPVLPALIALIVLGALLAFVAR